MRLAVNVEGIGEMVNEYRIFVKYRNGRDDSNVDGKAVLRWILRKQGVKAWTGFVWPRLETSGGFVNHGYVPMDFTKIPRIS